MAVTWSGKQSQLGGLLHRICIGLGESQATFINSMQHYLHESQTVQEKQNEELRKVLAQFSEFKKQNNLDEYFEKYLNAGTRKQTLALVRDVLQKEDDWVDKMQDYFNSLQKYQYSDTSLKLVSLSEEMGAVKQRIAIFEEQNQVVEQVIHEAMAKQPMTPHAYGKEMN